jgi:predicted dehydrogenase/threonine dehydrogenase-like Zn-dependent dehydrogenase
VKQILQNLSTGATEVVEVPCPGPRPGHVLLRTTRTLISTGTERKLLEFGKASPLEKARQQPDKVRQVFEKIKTDGLMPTIDSVRNKLDQPVTLGYCHVGRVIDSGNGRAASTFAPGDRVASNGRHAEVVSVPLNLCARIPDAVSDDEAAFTVIGAIALQGIRLAQPTLGEAFVVSGLGLIGQVTVQLLRAHGCRVLGIDVDASRLELARRFGAEVVDLSVTPDPVAAATQFSRGRGVDAVIVTAATPSSEPMHHAALMCRKRGRIVLVGVTGLELSRDDFFKKELSFQVSCSYGPGRYDTEYEDKGHDYPVGYVRWTEQRNFEAVLDMMAEKRIDVGPLVSHRFTLDRVAEAYAVVGGSEPSLGILLEYPASSGGEGDVRDPRVALAESGRTSTASAVSLAFIGAGNYATAMLIPAFKDAGAGLETVVSSGGVSAVHAGRKFGFRQATTDADAVFSDPAINAVVVTTRHDSHARFVVQAIEAGRHVFVEKPLCMTLDELTAIEGAYARQAGRGAPPIVAVGFNRRFAPHAQRSKILLAGVTGPKVLLMTVNAGAIPADHWTQDQAAGGGRILGEACHFIDLLRFLTGSPITGSSVVTMTGGANDTVTIQLTFADGSIGTIHYLANGSKAFPKERLEVFAQGRVLQLDNFRTLRGFGWPGFSSHRLWRQDKGQRACAAAFVQAVRDPATRPVPFEEVLEVSRVAIEVAAKV